ncbi:tetratricopeptide repeat protein [Akkermansiaceae bacterium]|nr:tetratricopeptide repeat protein [Akkermansiaceae bacterium]
MKFPRAILASITALLPLMSPALSPLEQIPVETFGKMKETERYQMRIAEKHYTDKNFKTALAEYEKFLTLYEKSPGAPYAQLMWSHSMMHLKKPKTALREGFQSVIDYWPESQEATIAAYCMADAYRTMGEVKSAQEAFRFLIREYPDHEIAVRSRTDLLHYARLHQDKEEEMSLLQDLAFKVKRTETSKETCASAARELAEIHFFAQRFDEGKKALATNYSGKELFDNVFNLSAKTVGHLLKDEKTKAAAINLADQLLASLQQDIKERPDEGKEILYKAVGLNATLGRPAEIWKIYEEIAERYGRDDGILGKMAEWYKQRDKREDARRIYAEFKDQVAGLKNIAAMHLEEGKVKEAIEIYRKLIEIDGDHADEHLWAIAGCYEKLSDWKSAIGVYRQVNRFPESNFRMASCHRRLGEHKEAILLYGQCMVADSAAPEATLQTAFTYEEAKEKENAIRTFQLTCRRHPKSGQAGKAHAHLQNKYNINVTLGGSEED